MVGEHGVYSCPHDGLRCATTHLRQGSSEKCRWNGIYDVDTCEKRRQAKAKHPEQYP